MSSTTVEQLMSAPVQTVESDATLGEAARAMDRHRIGAVVVADDDEPVGIISERDVLRAFATGADPEGPVRDWMTAPARSATPKAQPADALQTMRDGDFRHLPVVADGGLRGIVSVRDLIAVARLEPVDHPGELEAPRGLEGVIVAETEVGDVRGDEGFYHYRQYAATDLARDRTLEDVWHLMLRGELPSGEQRAAFADEVGALRTVPPRTADLLPAIAATAATPLEGLRTALSVVGGELGLGPSFDTPAAELERSAVQLIAMVPTIIAALHRLGRGDEPVKPDPDLPWAADYLRMLDGRRPRPDRARALEQYLITTVDHGFNASTFTARVVTSTGADLAAAMVAAVGALSGPLHGGAPSRALDLLDEIGEPARAEEIVRRKVEAGERIMGFGHRVYRTRDPRSELLREVALQLGGPRAELAVEVERTVVDVLAELKPGRELYANVEFYAGVIFERIGLPPALFTATFTSSRTIGWAAHILEQAADNRLIRPTARYVGPFAPAEVPHT